MMAAPFSGLHAGVRPFLLARMRIVAALRELFAARDFVEVETATLVLSPGNETHLHAFATELVGPAGVRARLYLRTSPEFACKKLLAAGERRIVEFARAFRNRERGALHHPEFTMLEWYRVEEPCEVLMQDCAAVLAVAAKTAGTTQFSLRGRAIDPFAAPERLTVAQAFSRYAGTDLLALLPPQPAPVFADAAEQRKRLEEQMLEKERVYGERYPIDEDFLTALSMMPDACGVALGLDRLVMLAAGATHIDDVVWTPSSAI